MNRFKKRNQNVVSGESPGRPSMMATSRVLQDIRIIEADEYFL